MYDDALKWCREELLFDPVPYLDNDDTVLCTPLAERCCHALDGYDDDYEIPDVFFDASFAAAREANATVGSVAREPRDYNATMTHHRNAASEP